MALYLFGTIIAYKINILIKGVKREPGQMTKINLSKGANMELKPDFETINVEGCMTSLVANPTTRVRDLKKRIKKVRVKVGPKIEPSRPRGGRRIRRGN